MKLIKDYIRVYDDVIDKDLCGQLIDCMDTNPDLHQRIESDLRPQCTQFNFTKLYQTDKVKWEPMHYLLQAAYMCCINLYKTEAGVKEKFQNDVALEEFRITKYNSSFQDDCTLPSGHSDQDKEHVDVQDYNSARRYLGMILYLSEPNEGEDVFPHINYYIKPKCGRMLVFPSNWMFPHLSKPCRKTAKYQVGSYLHYL